MAETDINELFQRDPLKLTRPDIESIIAKFRSLRGQFALGNMKAGSTKPPTAKQKAANALADQLKLDIDDLL